jgi:hypothetical protein
MKYIIVYGDPINGLYFVGPFDDANEAGDYASDNIDGEWWIAKLESY